MQELWEVSLKPGDWVRWADEKRDRPKAPLKSKEIFVVRKVSANGRCDLMDSQGAELFDIPLSHLQLLEMEHRPKNTPYRRKGMPFQ
jgi:hypothetical protein